MNILAELAGHSKFLQLMFEEYDLNEFNEDEEQDIINTFPIQFRDKLDLALDFLNFNLLPKDYNDLRLLVELLHYFYVDKAKDIYKIIFNSSFYEDLNEDLKLEIYRYLNSFK
jgi:hypothetical protein